MDEMTGAEAIVRMLQLHEVKYIFGLCGDTSLPFYDALYRLDHGMTHILARDERSASYMADVYARVSGKPGVCEGPSGGGATYILPGIAEANMSSVPLLAITTDIATTSRGHFTLTELDQENLFRPLTKFNHVIDTPGEIPDTVRTSFKQMTTGRTGAAHIGLPFDVQTGTVQTKDVWVNPAFGYYPAQRAEPDPDAVAAASELILSAENPVIISGGGTILSGAENELCALAELLDAPVATSINGKGSIHDDHPLAVGVVGSNGGTEQTQSFIQEADLIIFVGSKAGSVTTERMQAPIPGKPRIVHIDVDPSVIGANYEADAAVSGDARICLDAIYTEISERLDLVVAHSSNRTKIADAKAEKFAAFRELAGSNDTPIKPECILAILQNILPRDTIIVSDPGTPCPYLSAYYMQEKAGRRFVTNRAHGALGYSLPGVIGAYFARPESKCIGIMGDGSFGFAAGDLETISRLGIPVTLIVISNGSFGWIKAGQKYGYDERFYSVDFTQINHAKVAKA